MTLKIDGDSVSLLRIIPSGFCFFGGSYEWDHFSDFFTSMFVGI
jgi:hypothetical protein